MDEERMEAISTLTQSEGWKILKNWIEKRVDSEKESLLVCPIEEVPVKRAEIKAYKSILYKVVELMDLPNTDHKN